MPNMPHRHSFVGGMCRCGQPLPAQATSAESGIAQGVDTALLHGLFPEPVLRRTLLRTVGAIGP